MGDNDNQQHLSEEDRKQLARDILNEFWQDIDQGLGRGLRKFLTGVLVMLLLVGGIYYGIIKVPVTP